MAPDLLFRGSVDPCCLEQLPGDAVEGGEEVVNDQPEHASQMLRSHMTPLPVQVSAVQSMLTVWPAKNPTTAFMTPPWEAKEIYEKTQLTTTHEVTTGM